MERFLKLIKLITNTYAHHIKEVNFTFREIKLVNAKFGQDPKNKLGVEDFLDLFGDLLFLKII